MSWYNICFATHDGLVNCELLVQVIVTSLEKKCEESSNQALDAESRIIQLKIEMQRLIFNYFFFSQTIYQTINSFIAMSLIGL